jgi:hypothetical protein
MSKIIKLILLFGVLSITLICTSYKNKDGDKIRKVIISRNYPNIQPNGKIKYSDSRLTIYYCNEYEVYEFTSIQNFFTLNGEGKTINDSNRIVPEYFICKKKQNSGIIYSKVKDNSIDSYKKSVAKVDSIIYRVLFASLDLDSANFTLVESKSESLGILEEKYVPKMKSLKPESLIDTISFFFSKNMMDIDYSFSKKTDSLKNSKFIGYKARFLSKYYGNHPIKIDEIKLNLNMKKVPVDNKEFIISFIEHFKKDEHILNSQR